MGHKLGSHGDVNARHTGHESGNFGGTGSVSSAIPIAVQAGVGLQLLLSFQLLQVSYGQFQNVGFF